MAVRRNILTNAPARAGYIRGVKLLKGEGSGTTTRSLGIPGPSKELSTFDLFVVWHHWAMEQFTPPTQSDRNAAHRGPVFLPWHRHMLILLEAQLQRVLRDQSFGLPYWDWAADGERPKPDQPRSRLWGPSCMGGDGDPAAGGAVANGPFSATSGWRVEVAANSNGVLRSVNRPLRRAFSVGLGLPLRSQVGQALTQTPYDAAPWSALSAGFRNRLEGWFPPATTPHLHNRVHVWVGGDMLLSSSPNDPVFYLNHCNVDRIWAAWQRRHTASPYRPDQTAPQTLLRHRIDDPMYSIFASGGNGATPRQVLDVANIYTYASLAVA
ncbi:MAG: tyrosinase family protein [Actinomycetota bacterium]|nr:tyrosinase family protein [Actinomycetota bacterium]